jgi:glyoxylase I family protein
MEKVLGIGGVFFAARDPEALASWYEEFLGISRVPVSYEEASWQQQAGPTEFCPFDGRNEYLSGLKANMILNFRVANLDRMVDQLRAGGIAVEVDPTDYPNGRFALLADPEGNPIQLWQVA